MNKCLVALWLIFFPLLAMAADPVTGSSSSLSFTPPATDLSVMFLANLFGVVDGVLHGTGSQIMGAIFTVFNAAVLALGGIVITYTLIVGTMNTAHEGEMLGKKWSSIWIPVRSTMGLALLIPKASGYCLMQIFVMWVVVQGVGAADKVWNAALDYLNRGGVIIQAQMKPAISKDADKGEIATGGLAMLTGQVCMLGLQKVLETQRQNYLALSGQTPPLGPCAGTPSNPPTTLQTFCTTPVPDLVSSVNAVGAMSSSFSTTQSTYSVPMPNLPEGPYSVMLNGICGKIVWNAVATTDVITPSDAQTMTMSRATAVQQMYVDYTTVAQTMVSNDPQIIPTSGSTTTTPAFPQATNVFGVPYSESTNQPCAADTKDCFFWQGGGTNTAPIFNGSEFQNGVADYNGVMMPTINLISQMNAGKKEQDKKKFIHDAEAHGWLSAGSYFFDLVRLNGSATKGANKTDTDTGLGSSIATPQNMLDSFSSTDVSGSNPANCTSDSSLCSLFDGDPTGVNNVIMLINNFTEDTPTIPVKNTPAVQGQPGSTVFGFITNSMLLQLPGQPGTEGPKFSLPGMPRLDIDPPKAKFRKYKCHIKSINSLFNCMGKAVTNGIADLFQTILTDLLKLVVQWESIVLVIVISQPLAAMEMIFTNAVNYLASNNGANPVIALANMGIDYINESVELYLGIVTVVLVTSKIPYVNIIVAVLIAVCSPFMIAWMGVMLTIGFATAYYVPFIPYMVFTFGVIAWLMAVIEAMVAAPIVALGITHPEGEGILGKGEQAIMILMNVFLRPAMMIIGYIAAIALCYVSVWILNTGAGHVLSFLQHGAYKGWASIYALFFSVLIYTTMYMTMAQKAFNLIYMLPDNVLRWIGGHPEQIGHEAAGWAEESKKKVEEGGKATADSQAQVLKKAQGAVAEMQGPKGGGTTQESTGDKEPPSTPPPAP